MKLLVIRDLLSQLNTISQVMIQRSPEYLEWINSDLVDIVEEFTQKNNLTKLYFIKRMNNIFKTSRFELLLKRWLVEYFLKLFKILDCSKGLILEDNPLNRFGAEKYYARFKIPPKLKWKKQGNLLQKILSILLRAGFISYFSLNNGFKIFVQRKKYKVMREALWGLYGSYGYYFHDDFFIDGINIKKEDLLLFSRGIPTEEGRLKGYKDVRKSSYAYFDINSLSISAKSFFLRIVPKYIILANNALFREIYSAYFSLYWSVYLYFIYNAVPYERVFSNFEIVSEFGHNYFFAGHIPEAIICQNYGTKYYLTHWSDNSVGLDKYVLSFLGCDGFLLWGKAHIQGVEGGYGILMLVGYIFKRFIKEVILNRDKILVEMGIKAKGKIITFFDESYGRECKMTEENYIIFWETALKVAQIEEGNTILIKPKMPIKEIVQYNDLSDSLKKKLFAIRDEMERLSNVYIIDPVKWSFIESIGVSDIVITQGMSSSATIAIICGIEGLYLDQAAYDHPFSRLFKDSIVFNDPEKLISMIQKIMSGMESPLRCIPDDVLRSYDAYSDDRGIDLFRNILTGQV